MIGNPTWPCAALSTAVLILLSGCATTNSGPASSTGVHCLEIVCTDVEAQCAALERVHGVTFGSAVADMGGARLAEGTDNLFAVRAPLAEHEQPIMRTYMAVDDITEAVARAEAAGAMLAYPPTKQGDTGTWAIYIHGGVQHGLWQR